MNQVQDPRTAFLNFLGDAGAIDSDAADNIIQLGIFGTIVFG